MLIRSTAVLAALAMGAPALADDIPTFQDRGIELAQDPYTSNTALTTGRIAGFRELYGDPDALADGLAPSGDEPSDAKADLPVVNTRTAWAEVRINGVKVGRIGPLGDGVIKGVTAGEYQVGFTLPNGFSFTRDVVAAPEEHDEPEEPEK